MICTHCGHVGRMTVVDSSYPMDGGAAMVPDTYLACPMCGMDDVEPCRPCGVCGDMVGETTRDANGGWICGGCKQAAYNKLQAFRATLRPAEINVIAWMLEDCDIGAWREAEC